jgi:hypothetical protein
MAKHNKKRNVGIIYELLLNYIGENILEDNKPNVRKATKIIEKRFAKGTELYKEFRLFNALVKTNISNTHIMGSILSEAKNSAKNYNSESLEAEKSRLIRDINYKLNDKNFYYRNINNYRELGNIQMLVNEWRSKSPDIGKLINFEKTLCENLLKEKSEKSLEDEMKNINASDSNRLVFKIMTEKFNKKYGEDLEEDQKEIIKNYVFYQDDNTGEKFLSEFFLQKKKEALNLLEGFQDTTKNKFLLSKVKSVRSKIEEVKTDVVNDDLVIKFLTVTKLIKEIKGEGLKNE